MFGNANEPRSEIPAFKPKSTFMPYTSNPSIQTFCRLVEQETLDLLKDTPPRHTPNMNKDEFSAIQELSNDSEIIIKPADKGGSIVVQNMSDYKEEAYRQLNDEQFYRRLKTNPTRDFQKRL